MRNHLSNIKIYSGRCIKLLVYACNASFELRDCFEVHLFASRLVDPDSRSRELRMRGTQPTKRRLPASQLLRVRVNILVSHTHPTSSDVNSGGKIRTGVRRHQDFSRRTTTLLGNSRLSGAWALGQQNLLLC